MKKILEMTRVLFVLVNGDSLKERRNSEECQ